MTDKDQAVAPCAEAEINMPVDSTENDASISETPVSVTASDVGTDMSIGEIETVVEVSVKTIDNESKDDARAADKKVQEDSKMNEVHEEPVKEDQLTIMETDEQAPWYAAETEVPEFLVGVDTSVLDAEAILRPELYTSANANVNELKSEEISIRKDSADAPIVEVEKKDLNVTVDDNAASSAAVADMTAPASSDEDTSSSEESDSEEESDDEILEADIRSLINKAMYDVDQEIEKVTIKTANELLLDDLPPEDALEVDLPPNADLAYIGKVTAYVDGLAIVTASNGSMALDIDTILFVDKFNVLGRVWEVFGQVESPFYSVRLPANSPYTESPNSCVGKNVAFVSNIPDMRKFVLAAQLNKFKGTDASWQHDEEPPEGEMEYSDDEAEAAAKAERKKRNKNKAKEATEVAMDGESQLRASLQTRGGRGGSRGGGRSHGRGSYKNNNYGAGYDNQNNHGYYASGNGNADNGNYGNGHQRYNNSTSGGGSMGYDPAQPQYYGQFNSQNANPHAQQSRYNSDGGSNYYDAHRQNDGYGRGFDQGPPSSYQSHDGYYRNGGSYYGNSGGDYGYAHGQGYDHHPAQHPQSRMQNAPPQLDMYGQPIVRMNAPSTEYAPASRQEYSQAPQYGQYSSESSGGSRGYTRAFPPGGLNGYGNDGEGEGEGGDMQK
eukprot:CFRG7833T1